MKKEVFCIESYHDIILDNEIIKENDNLCEKYEEKGKITDLLVEIEGTLVNLEMNRNVQVGTVIKNNIYHHKLMSQYLSKGEKYIDTNIVVQINFNAVDRFDDRVVIKFMMRDEENKYCLDEKYINFQVNMVRALEKWYNRDNLSKFEKIIAMMMMEEKEDLREISKGDEELMAFEKKIEELSEDEEIIGLYDEKEMNELVNRLNRAQDRKEARAEGLAEGHAEGRAEGIEEATKKIVINMLKSDVSMEDIIKFTGIKEEDVLKIKETM